MQRWRDSIRWMSVFIELMPVGCGSQYHGISSDRVLEKLEQQYGRAVPVQADNEKGGPAKYYDFTGFQGKVGVISAMSHQFLWKL